jgi:hypothetical protein
LKVNFAKVANAYTAITFPERKYLVANDAPLEIDTSKMRLDGTNYYLSPSSPSFPELARTAYKSPGSHEIRLPTGGTPPYTYTSQNSKIASVNLTSGLVYSVANGTTMIVVEDVHKNTVQYPVECTNVFELFALRSSFNWNQAITALRENNIDLISNIHITDGKYPPISDQFRPTRYHGGFWGPVNLTPTLRPPDSEYLMIPEHTDIVTIKPRNPEFRVQFAIGRRPKT